MATLELVEKLRKHAEVSYDDAREALDACGDDLLDAIIYLERKGKIPKPQGGSYTTEKEPPRRKEPPKPDYEARGENFGKLVKRFFKWLGVVIKKGNKNLFVIRQPDGELASLPVTLLVVLLICCFWIVVPLLVAGLFFGFRYHFRGQEMESIGANRVMDGAATMAEDLKRSVKTQHGEDHQEDESEE